MPHVGYDINGRRVLKPATKDELDKFLASIDDKDYGSTIYDAETHQDLKLTSEEINMLKRIQKNAFPDEQFDPYAPSIDFFTQDKLDKPLINRNEPKARSEPSKWEKQKIHKIVMAIRKGWIQQPEQRKKGVSPDTFYTLWDDAIDKPKAEHVMHIPAPKMRLPDNSESYHPPKEYLMTKEEEEEWKATAPEDRKQNYIPKDHSNLRSVAAYARSTQERFDRCLDLYMAPRAIKNRLNIDPESLLPTLPQPQELQPFPSVESVKMEHGVMVNAMSIDDAGRYVASGGNDGTVKVWEILTGRLFAEYTFEEPITSLQFNPATDKKGMLMVSRYIFFPGWFYKG